jgi:hypothetical protein
MHGSRIWSLSASLNLENSKIHFCVYLSISTSVLPVRQSNDTSSMPAILRAISIEAWQNIGKKTSISDEESNIESAILWTKCLVQFQIVQPLIKHNPDPNTQ